MRRAATNFLSFLIILAGISSVAFAEKTSVPEWVRQAAAQSVPVYPSDTDSVVLLDDVTYVVIGTGEYIEQHRRAVKILRPSGIPEGTFRINLRGDDKISSLHGWSIDSSGHEFELREKEFLERAMYMEAMYDDVRYRVGTVPAAQVGSVVALEFEVRRRSFLDQFLWIPQEDCRVLRASITIQLPAGYEYRDSWYGMSPASRTEIAPNRWQWAVANLPLIKREDFMPSFAALAGRMKLTYFGRGMQSMTDSWNSLGDWYNKLTADRRTPTPEIKQKVAELIAGKSDFLAQARALTDFMQSEIRYVAIEIGIGGYQPHPAADVYRARYGDCKDKATLLSTMLREAGIASDYVVISTERGVVKPEVPSSFFNHVILAIELPSGTDSGKLRSVVKDKNGKQYLLFDPTNPYTPLGEIPSYLQGSYALLVTAAGGEIIRTPILDPDVNRYVRRGTFKLTADGTLEGEVEGKMSGSPASENRDLYRSLNDQERKQVAERFITRFVKAAALKDLKLDALEKNSDELVMRYGLTGERYAQISGPLMLVRPRVLGQHAFPLEKKERQNPIELQSTAEAKDEFEIEIPAGYSVDDLPAATKAESPFGTYESHYEAQGSKIIYKRTYIRRALEIPTDKIAEFRAFNDRIAADENSVVVLKKIN